jgi:acetyl esterase/lipase
VRRLAIAVASGLLALALPGAAQAADSGVTVQYGATLKQNALVYPAGARPVLLLHMKGQTAEMLHNVAEYLQAQGFTVYDLNWQEPRGAGGVFPADTNQVAEAIAYVRRTASLWGVDAGRLTAVGGSRGALLALLASERSDDATLGSVRAVASLSGTVDPKRSIERARAGESAPKELETLDGTFGCPSTTECDEGYVGEWSPVVQVDPTTPAMFLAASETEDRAWPADQYETAHALAAVGVPSSVVITSEGHGFGYWGKVRSQVVAFLAEHS